MGDGPGYDHAYRLAEERKAERICLADRAIRDLLKLMAGLEHNSAFERVNFHLDDAYSSLIRIREGY